MKTPVCISGLLCCLQLLFPAGAVEVPVGIEAFDGEAPRVKRGGGGSVLIAPGGGLSLRVIPTAPPPPGATVFECEIFSLGGCEQFAALPGPPFESKTARYLPAIGHSEAWTPYVANLVSSSPLPEGWKQLRFDLPLGREASLQIRNARLRAPRPGEFTPKREDHGDLAHQLESYLGGPAPARIGRVELGADDITISGRSKRPGATLLLAEVPMDRQDDDPQRFEFITPVETGADGRFTKTVPRTRQRAGHRYDRLTSKWQLLRRIDEALVPVSHARYPDTIPCRSPKLPAARPKTKKGLGGWSARRGPKGELERLGISSITVNLMVHSVLSETAGHGTFPVRWQGRTYHANRDALERFDTTFREAAQHEVMVSVILLIANPAKGGNAIIKTLGHPNASPAGTFAMPNVTDPEGLAMYGAALDLMAERWSRPDGKYGRVHHWIVHNEIDAGWTWTNAGELPDIVFLDLYQRSMRLVHLIARQYDPNARPFISLTHHWAETVDPHFYPSKRMLELLAAFSRTEGDFPWAIAHHPYPQSLRKPRTWEDKQPTFSFDTPKITPRNIEVLDAWVKRPSMRFRGQHIRPVHLSENGFNSPDYSEKSLRDQAAGMAYAWKKIQRLETIEAWQYHNWIDNRHEGGLRIGLRKFPDAPGDPHGPKPIWHLYRALATPAEDKACAPYLPVVGLPDWNAALHQEPIR